MYGATWLLDRIAEKTGLTSDLRKVFGGNMEMVNDILTLAYYPFVDNLSYNQLSFWQREVKAPSGRALNSVSITRLTQSITEKNRMDLFRMRAARMGKDELCAVDSTSMSTYGFNLVDIRWGKNKEHLPLRQTLEVVVYSLSTHMPIYYKELPGNMPDCRTVELILTELEHAGFRNLILITDRGYESMKNLEMYIAKGQKVITSVKVSNSDVLNLIKGIDMSEGYPKGMKLSAKEKLYYAQYSKDYFVSGNGDNVIKADKYRINLYFSPMKRAEAMCDIQEAIDGQSAAVAALVADKKRVVNQDDVKRQFNMLKLSFNEDSTIASFEENAEKKASMLSPPASLPARLSEWTLTLCRPRTTTACVMSRRSALRCRKAPSIRIASEPGQKRASTEGCSSASWDSSSHHMSVTSGRRTSISGRTSTPPSQSLPRCAPYAA